MLSEEQSVTEERSRKNGSLEQSQTLMIQGTTSDAGKSALVTGLCRLMKRRGFRAAPFKPQNMALNSAVTAEGGEVGRAQALQALAAGIEPHVDHNPVLIKPNSDTGAQIIVHGHAIGSMNAEAYHRLKPELLQSVLDSWQRLTQKYQLVLAEGAGSPAEINLREGDIANMGFAEAADCPVVLVADIDRGGVFAHLYGTLALLSESEQARVKGFVINRFRGDIKLLEPGLEWLEAKTGKPVFGVLPYLHGLHLESEDAIHTEQQFNRNGGRLRIAIPVLTRTSNHTDFDPLRLRSDVEVLFVSDGKPLPSVDLVILPGTKNSRQDLAFVRHNGWDQQLVKHLRYGGKLLGICGGLQMLGRAIHDPEAIEGSPGSSEGLGFFGFETTMSESKTLERVTGELKLPDTLAAEISGYEIHCGVTEGLGQLTSVIDVAGRTLGVVSDDRQIIGTYLHGLFESPKACSALLQWAGLSAPEPVDYAQLREQNIDRIADAIAEHIDIEKLLGADNRRG